MKLFTGAITAIVTPFNAQGDVDFAVLRKLVNFQLDNGINGIVPCGSTGEAATLADEEYEAVIRTVVNEANGRVPVIAGAGSNDTLKAINFSQLAKRAGADGLLHVTPYYNKPTVNGLLAHFNAIASAVDLPIILYNVPGRTGSNITAKTTIRIAQQISQVVAVKEASGDITQMMEIISGRSKDFSVLSGDDSLTLPLLSAGGDGCISVVANLIPAQFSRLVSAGLQGDYKTAREIHYKYLSLMNSNFIETNPQPVKSSLAMMGLIEERFRLPMVSVENDNKVILQHVLKEVGLL